MQSISQKEVVFKAYQIEKDLYQQRLIANTIKEEISDIQRDGRILQAINNNTGYSKGKKVDAQEEMVWSYFEEESPYKRMQSSISKPHFLYMFEGEVFGIFVFITLIVIIFATVVAYELDRVGHIRWIWTDYFWD